MAKKKQHIDEFFRDRLQGMEVPASEGDFNAIIEGLNSGRRKRRGFWWIIGGLALIAGLSAWFLFADEPNAPLTENTPSTISREPSASDAGVNEDESPANSTSPDFETATQENSPSEEHIEPWDNSSAPGSASTSEEVFSSESPETVVAQDPANYTTGAGEADPAGANLPDNTPIEVDEIDEANEDPESNTHKTENDPVASDVHTTADHSDQPESSDEIEEVIEKDAPEQDQESEEEFKETIAPKVITDTSAQGTSVPTAPNPYPWTPWVRISTGMGFPSFTNISGSSDEALYEEYKSNEAGQPGIRFDIGAGIKREHWGFGSGLNYAEYNFENPNFQVQLYDSFPLLNPTGDTIAWFKNNYRDSTYGNVQKSKYRVLSVPLKASYSWNIGNLWRITGGAGIVISYNLSQDGITIDHNFEAIDASKTPLKDLMLGYDLTIMTEYALKPNWLIGLEAGYANTIGGMYQPSSPSTMDLRNTNLKMSLTYELK